MAFPPWLRISFKKKPEGVTVQDGFVSPGLSLWCMPEYSQKIEEMLFLIYLHGLSESNQSLNYYHIRALTSTTNKNEHDSFLIRLETS